MTTTYKKPSPAFMALIQSIIQENLPSLKELAKH